MVFRYSDEEIDKICSLTVKELDQCSVNLLSKIAIDSGIVGASSMRKEQLCKSIKTVSSLHNSEKLLKKCDTSISKVEKLYDPNFHDQTTKETIDELRRWYSDKTRKIQEIKSSERPSVFDLTSQYAEINTQCSNLTSGVKALMENNKRNQKILKEKIKRQKRQC
jgi:hypothetical protein